MSEREDSEIGATAPGEYGPAPSSVTIAEATFAAAWNVQGDAELFLFAETARQVFGLMLPGVPNTTSRTDALTALWLGPKSWLPTAGASACGANRAKGVNSTSSSSARTRNHER